MTRTCLIPGCDALLFIGRGLPESNRCAEHATVKAKAETDEQRIERVCKAMGWRRRK